MSQLRSCKKGSNLGPAMCKASTKTNALPNRQILTTQHKNSSGMHTVIVQMYCKHTVAYYIDVKYEDLNILFFDIFFRNAKPCICFSKTKKNNTKI